ncbi:hypothetical protein IWT140_02207 [Secundilactobacillus pentosiphilus]|uniref:Homeodomain phBC6A51-type domain-containing protein n=1 Tax=Secundilactobacillus pentosiphilus TaxID=1714682 RepID=A0A1Z5IS14_9LACO|nr:phBC6A51 family helix-turn-helix protein [Secundilactobacillus pentosiphilus]GAX04565.1 hypothetical protein IWT140_02207 [Secundilactobacillus pentosiphilus]
MDKIGQNSVFNKLDKPRREAIILLFEDDLSDVEIAKTVHRARSTLSKWKTEPEFIQAQDEYRHIAMDSYVPDSIKQLHKLSLTARSEMVQLQATNSILSLSGFGSADSNADLDHAKTRKANAEAEIAEHQAKLIAHPEEIQDRTVIIDDFTETTETDKN